MLKYFQGYFQEGVQSAVMNKVIIPGRILQCSTVICILFLCTHVLHCTARRGVGRPHTQATDRPADVFFAMKVTQPCGVGRGLLESVSREEVINMVQIVREEVNEATHDMVSYLFKII